MTIYAYFRDGGSSGAGLHPAPCSDLCSAADPNRQRHRAAALALSPCPPGTEQQPHSGREPRAFRTASFGSSALSEGFIFLGTPGRQRAMGAPPPRAALCRCTQLAHLEERSSRTAPRSLRTATEQRWDHAAPTGLDGSSGTRSPRRLSQTLRNAAICRQAISTSEGGLGRLQPAPRSDAREAGQGEAVLSTHGGMSAAPRASPAFGNPRIEARQPLKSPGPT